jgi:hypothetical protein
MSKIFDICDFGAKPNTTEDTIPAIQSALKQMQNENNCTLFFPAGEYHCYPNHADRREYYISNTDVINPRRIGFLFKDMHNITLEGEPHLEESPSKLIFHGRICPVVADHTDTLTVRNLVIDWDRSLESESRVIAVEKNYIDIELNETQYPFVIEHGKIRFIVTDVEDPQVTTPKIKRTWKEKISRSFWSGEKWWGVMEFDPETRTIPPNTGDSTLGWGWNTYKAKRIGPNIVRLYHRFRNPPKVGHWLVMRHHNRDHAGMFFTQSKNLAVVNVSLFTTQGLGIISQFCENLLFNRVRFVPNRKKRMFISGRDDGLHFSNCKGQIMVESCAFEGLMDDPMNVHGTSVAIISKDTQRIIGRFMHNQSIGFIWAQHGDVVSFINRKSMKSIGTATVKNFRLCDCQTFEIEFETPIPAPIKEQDAMENLSWTPDLTFRNNQVLSCRARGILVSTPGKVIIEQNYFKSSGSPILIAGDANYWWESGAVKDVTIRDNIFSEFCLANMYGDCEAIISIAPVIPQLDYQTPFHRQILIEQNKFYPSDYPVLYARSTTDLTFRNNYIEHSHRFAPYHHRKATISLDACSQVRIERNEWHGEVLGKNIRFEKMPPSEIFMSSDSGLTLE